MSSHEELRALLAKATPGPWELHRNGVIAFEDGWDHITPGWSEENRALIVAAVNALPALLDALATERAAREKAEAQAEKFSDQVHWTLRRAEIAESERDALAARVEGLEAALRLTEFGFNHRRCPVCAGFNVGPNGETDRVHTKNCPVGAAIAPGAGGGES